MNLLALNSCSLCWKSSATTSVARGYICEDCMLQSAYSWVEAKEPNAKFEPKTLDAVREMLGNELTIDEIAARFGAERKWIIPVIAAVGGAAGSPF